MIDEELKNIFTYHSPKNDQPKRYEALRIFAYNFALEINALCPDSREKSLAITNIQQAVMWANASIAINEKEEENEIN